MNIPVPAERIEQTFLVIRGHRVMLDTDLADLYDVEVKQLKRQVRRNKDRFPGDFLLELSQEEHRALRCQIGTLKMGGHSKEKSEVVTICDHLRQLKFAPAKPFACTEQGVATLQACSMASVPYELCGNSQRTWV